jgi:hypothetical protein
MPISLPEILRILGQHELNLRNMRRDMRSEAAKMKEAASLDQASTKQVADTLSGLAVEFQKRLDWLPALKSDPEIWPAIEAFYAAFGRSTDELEGPMAELQAAADKMRSAGNAEIATICDEVTALTEARSVSLWPE